MRGALGCVTVYTAAPTAGFANQVTVSSHGTRLVPKLHFITIYRSRYKRDSELNTKVKRGDKVVAADFLRVLKMSPKGFVTVTREQLLCNGARPTSC